MMPLHVEANGADILFNSLYENPEPPHLMQDLLAVELPNGYCIDVGWYPQFDPAGRYRITILDEDGSNMGTVFETRDVHLVVELVEGLANNVYAEDELSNCSTSSSAGYVATEFTPEEYTSTHENSEFELMAC